MGAGTFARLLRLDRDELDDEELITDKRSGACSEAATRAGATGGFRGVVPAIGCPA